jgi:hypothetical protein
MRALRLCLLLVAALGLSGCLRYEYEHEFWLRVDGSGTVYVTGRPELWTAFKGVGNAADPRASVTTDLVTQLFERSGLRVRRARITHRDGRPYLFVAADFDDVNRLAGTPAFPDLQITLRPRGDRLDLAGVWSVPAQAPRPQGLESDGLTAVRFHLPSKVYGHKNAVGGVERGNIVAWSSEIGSVLTGHRLDFGAEIDRRSILLSTVGLFAGAIVLGLSAIGLAFWLAIRRGRRVIANEAGVSPR